MTSRAAQAATVGGIVGQEIMKCFTNKYMPLTQWLYLEFSEVEFPPPPSPPSHCPQTGRLPSPPLTQLIPCSLRHAPRLAGFAARCDADRGRRRAGGHAL